MVTAHIIADSVSPMCERVTTFLLTYPRFIHAEVMTHRAFSKNSASSRAIPILKMIAAVWKTPAMPERWGAKGKGMQDSGVLSPFKAFLCKSIWLLASKVACLLALLLYYSGVSKQIANRILEPFAHMTVVLTGGESGFLNFFKLRAHTDAEPTLQVLAYRMLDAYRLSKPTVLAWGMWHAPFIPVSRFSTGDDAVTGFSALQRVLQSGDKLLLARALGPLCTSVASCARTSYNNHGKETTLEEDAAMLVRLLGGSGGVGHLSPFEHQAQVNFSNDFSNTKYCGNLPPSFTQLRKLCEKPAHLAFPDGPSVFYSELMTNCPDWFTL